MTSHMQPWLVRCVPTLVSHWLRFKAVNWQFLSFPSQLVLGQLLHQSATPFLTIPDRFNIELLLTVCLTAGPELSDVGVSGKVKTNFWEGMERACEKGRMLTVVSRHSALAGCQGTAKNSYMNQNAKTAKANISTGRVSVFSRRLKSNAYAKPPKRSRNNFSLGNNLYKTIRNILLTFRFLYIHVIIWCWVQLILDYYITFGLFWFSNVKATLKIEWNAYYTLSGWNILHSIDDLCGFSVGGGSRNCLLIRSSFWWLTAAQK